MVGRQADVAGLRLHHRQREFIGQRGERRHCFRRAAGRRRQDQRKLRLGDERGGFLDRPVGRHRRGRTHGARGLPARRHRGVRQHLAGQCQVHRPARLRHRDVEGAVDDGVRGLPGAQLVVPFDEFPRQAALVEHLLAPVDRAVARGLMAGLGDGRAAGAEQDRRIVARGVHDPADRIGGADRHMHHHDGGLAADAVIAVRHRHRDVLMGHGDDARIFPVGAGVARQRLDDRREIGAGIGEHVFDPAIGQAGEEGLGGHAGGGVGHGFVLVLAGDHGRLRGDRSIVSHLGAGPAMEP